MATKKGREQSKRETWESLKEEGNKLFSHRKYEQGNNLKWAASSRWSFCPNSGWDSIETTVIKRMPSTLVT